METGVAGEGGGGAASGAWFSTSGDSSNIWSLLDVGGSGLRSPLGPARLSRVASRNCNDNDRDKVFRGVRVKVFSHPGHLKAEG